MDVVIIFLEMKRMQHGVSQPRIKHMRFLIVASDVKTAVILKILQ